MKIFFALALLAIIVAVVVRYEARSRRRNSGATYDASSGILLSDQGNSHGHHHHSHGHAGHADGGGSDGGGSDGGGSDGGGAH